MKCGGCDPGLGGALARIDDGVVLVTRMPLLDNKPDLQAIASFFRGCSLVILEKIGNRPGQSSVATMTSGVNWGMVVGSLIMAEIPYETVMPQTWKKEFGLNQKRGSAKMSKKEIKEASIAKCKALYPDVSLRNTSKETTDKDGLAEAILMATYGRRLQR